jgi:hypothetical protein
MRSTALNLPLQLGFHGAPIFPPEIDRDVSQQRGLQRRPGIIL